MLRERALGRQALAGQQFLCENVAADGMVEEAVLSLLSARVHEVSEHESLRSS